MVKGRKRGLIFGNQTFPAFGESLNSTLVLFLYRNAVNTIVSHGNADICRRVRHQKDKKRVASHMCLGLQGSNETAIHQHYAKEGRDVFQLRRYFHHYIKPRSPHNYRTVGFKFEALWSDFDEIARALCLPSGTEYDLVVALNCCFYRYVRLGYGHTPYLPVVLLLTACSFQI